MGDKSKVTILLPVWNGEAYLQQCVESVLSQGLSDWKLLIGDNGSTDGTIAYLDTLDDARISVFKHPRNLGIFGNLNFLLQRCRTDLAFVLCSDDFLHDNGLETIVEEWAGSAEGKGFMRFNWTPRQDANALLRLACDRISNSVAAVDSDLYFFLFGNVPGNLSNVAFDARHLSAAGGFREDLPYAGDFEAWSRMGRTHGFEVRRDRVSHIRRHENVASNYLNKRGELVGQSYEVLSEIYRGLSERYPNRLLRLHGTLSQTTRQIDAGLKAVLKTGKPDYLEQIWRHRNQAWCFGWVGCCLAYLVTFGGRHFTEMAPRRILALNDRRQKQAERSIEDERVDGIHSK